MPQLLFAFAFSAAPLTLYVPPVRSLNPFVEAVEAFLRQTALFRVRVYPRLHLAFSRIMSFWIRAARRFELVCSSAFMAHDFCVFNNILASSVMSPLL
ncbi:hypothetical protein Taro_027711 [Colocasia esculenta]|uniref:Secreted protein n=1 Tax=Colocasia esculenta TaxID=4460 RepID=A0A843VS88_COLES|nr:hypothetical protein [Colocasia esculenta]